MALTRDSVLFYWSSLYGLQPIVGGDPVFSRSSAARMRGAGRIGRQLIQGLPRFSRVTLNDADEVALQLEMARTNQVIHSSAIESWTSSGTIGVTTGIADPFGGTNARRVSDDDTGAEANKTLTLSFGSGGAKALSFWAKKGDSPGMMTMFLFDDGSPIYRARVRIDSWTGDSPDVVVTDGALLGVEPYAGGWYRVSVRAPGIVAGNAHRLVIMPARGDVANTGDIRLYGVQIEDGPATTGYIATNGSAVTRSADQLYFNAAPAPQEIAIYARLIEADPARTDNLGNRVVEIGDSSSNNPRILLYRDGDGLYRIYHGNAGSVTSDITLAGVAAGDEVELSGVLSADGSVSLAGSLNGAPIADGPGSAALALASAWSAARVHLNSVGVLAIGAGHYTEVKIVRLADVGAGTVQARMDELRDFVLDPAGNVI